MAKNANRIGKIAKAADKGQGKKEEKPNNLHQRRAEMRKKRYP